MRAALTLGLTYLVAAAALWLVSGCGGTERGKECFGIDDCGREQICFFGTCQDPGFSLQEVHAELTPATSSGYLQQQTGPLELSAGYQEVPLRAAVVVAGKVQDSADIPGTLTAITEGSIRGRSLTREAAAGPDGSFTLRALPGAYDLRFVPAAIDDATAPKPPISYGTTQIDAGTAQVDLPYPAPGELVTVTGRIRYTEQLPTPIEGALISGTAENEGGPELASSVAISDSAGSYTLVFPPGASVLTITIRPTQSPQRTATTESANPYLPETIVVRTLQPGQTELEEIVLGIEPGFVTITPEVQGDDGGPVANANVVFEGVVSEIQGRFTASAKIETDEYGVRHVNPAQLVPGEYRITVVPGKTLPYALTSKAMRIESGSTGPVLLTVGLKVKLSGVVTADDGAPVSQARLSLSLRNSSSPREYSVTTAADGSYEISVDPGTEDEPLEYELVVEPERSTGLPRHRELLRLGASDTRQDIQLYPSTFIYGNVVNAEGQPLADVTLAFYSLELGFEGTPVLVGLGFTTAKGEFVVPLPTPPR